MAASSDDPIVGAASLPSACSSAPELLGGEWCPSDMPKVKWGEYSYNLCLSGLAGAGPGCPHALN